MPTTTFPFAALAVVTTIAIFVFLRACTKDLSTEPVSHSEEGVQRCRSLIAASFLYWSADFSGRTAEDILLDGQNATPRLEKVLTFVVGLDRRRSRLSKLKQWHSISLSCLRLSASAVLLATLMLVLFGFFVDLSKISRLPWVAISLLASLAFVSWLATEWFVLRIEYHRRKAEASDATLLS